MIWQKCDVANTTYNISKFPIKLQKDIYLWCVNTFGYDTMGTVKQRKLWNYHHWVSKDKFWFEFFDGSYKILFLLKWGHLFHRDY